jgi:hypothetical protein
MPRGVRFIWSLVFIAVGIALLGGGANSLQNLSRALLVGAAAWSLALGVVLFAGLGSAPGMRPTRPLRFALLVTLPAFFLIGLAALATHVLSAGEFFGRGGLIGALHCSLHALGAGVLISGAILLLWRRTDPFTPGLTGALVGLVGGLAGAIGVSLACPSTEGWHLWLGHGFAILGVVLLGWLAGRRWLAP